MIQTEMSCEYEDFIGTYRNVFPDGFCRHVIDCFEDISQNSKWVISRQQENKNTRKHDKDDKAPSQAIYCKVYSELLTLVKKNFHWAV